MKVPRDIVRALAVPACSLVVSLVVSYLMGLVAKYLVGFL